MVKASKIPKDLQDRINEHKERQDNLEKLDLSNIPMKRMSKALQAYLSSIPELFMIYAVKCELKMLPLLSHENLRYLFLGHNELKDSVCKHFKNFPNLYKLDLQNNHLKNIISVYQGLQDNFELQQLILRDNKYLTYKLEDVIEHLPQIETIDWEDREDLNLISQGEDSPFQQEDTEPQHEIEQQHQDQNINQQNQSQEELTEFNQFQLNQLQYQSTKVSVNFYSDNNSNQLIELIDQPLMLQEHEQQEHEQQEHEQQEQDSQNEFTKSEKQEELEFEKTEKKIKQD